MASSTFRRHHSFRIQIGYSMRTTYFEPSIVQWSIYHRTSSSTPLGNLQNGVGRAGKHDQFLFGVSPKVISATESTSHTVVLGMCFCGECLFFIRGYGWFSGQLRCWERKSFTPPWLAGASYSASIVLWGRRVGHLKMKSMKYVESPFRRSCCWRA